MIRRKKKDAATIPLAGMADIAFLLLIFFLLVTTIDVDTGIGLVLPPPVEHADEIEVDPDNVTNILVNAEGEVLIDGNIIRVPQISGMIADRIRANPRLIVSVKTDRRTPYNVYIDTIDQLKMSYNELREDYARQNFGVRLQDVNREQLEQIREAIPQRISLAEPE
jgi:biopolymer transport protein ExbD